MYLLFWIWLLWLVYWTWWLPLLSRPFGAPFPALQLNWLNIFVTMGIRNLTFLCLFPGDHLSSQPGPPPLPPAPPPHRQHPSITSLSRSSLANQRSPSPPPTAGLAADLQSTAECVQLQDSWVLGSNVALESRWVNPKASTATFPTDYEEAIWDSNKLI